MNLRALPQFSLSFFLRNYLIVIYYQSRFTSKYVIFSLEKLRAVNITWTWVKFKLNSERYEEDDTQ